MIGWEESPDGRRQMFQNSDGARKHTVYAYKKRWQIKKEKFLKIEKSHRETGLHCIAPLWMLATWDKLFLVQADREEH